MTQALDEKTRSALFEYALRLGDDRLVLGHRLSEWCGHAPILEEDIAIANIALDLLGQATLLLKIAGSIEGKNRSEDDLAYFREAVEFRNVQLVEQPRGDFAFTIVRQFLFDAFSLGSYEELAKSSYEELAELSQKILKEIHYHLRHSREWMLRLGNGTDESHKRMAIALEELWTYTDELFLMDEVDNHLHGLKMVPDLKALHPRWKKLVTETIQESTLIVPSDDRYMTRGSRRGKHSEHLGHMLAEMQIVAHSYPGASW